MFLDTYNANVVDGGDSSDENPDEARAFFKRDSTSEITVGDKIYITGGELQQVFGTVVNFEDGGATVVFKPANIEGFTENMNIERSLVVKYFENGILNPVTVSESWRASTNQKLES